MTGSLDNSPGSGACASSQSESRVSEAACDPSSLLSGGIGDASRPKHIRPCDCILFHSVKPLATCIAFSETDRFMRQILWNRVLRAMNFLKPFALYVEFSETNRSMLHIFLEPNRLMRRIFWNRLLHVFHFLQPITDKSNFMKPIARTPIF